MANDWQKFKRAFHMSDSVSGLSKLQEEIDQRDLVIEQCKSQLLLLTATEGVYVKKALEELELEKLELEVQKGVLEQQLKDGQELDTLLTEDTGTIAVAKGALTKLQEALDLADREDREATAKVEEMELAMQVVVARSFPKIKRLLETMLEADKQYELQRSLVVKARKQLPDVQRDYDDAEREMTDLETDPKLLPRAAEIVETFRIKAQLLASKRKSVDLTFQGEEAQWKVLQEARAALELAVSDEVAKPEPTTSPEKEAYLELKKAWGLVEEAREKARETREVYNEARDKANEKKLNVKELEDRAAMLKAREGVLDLGVELSKLLNGTPELKTLVVWKESASVLLEKMGESAYNTFTTKALAFMHGLDGLIALGMKRDDIDMIYSELKWPENWHPPHMRPQEANWLKVKGSLKDDKIALEKQQTTLMVQALGFTEQNQDTVLTNFGDGMQTIGVLDKDDAEQVTQWLTLVSGVITLGTAGARAVSSTRTLMQTDDSVDPVEQLMLIDETLNNIASTAGGIIKTAQSAINVSKATQIAALVPGLGALSSFGSMCANASSATQYWVAAQADGEVHRKALEMEHRLEPSTDHVATRGAQVASRKTTQAASDLIAFCGHICTLAGVSAPVGVAMSTLSTVVSSSEKAVSWAVDATQMQRARELLKKAQGGDPEARAEIFREHPYYATAIIALLAEEGDTIALAIYGNHKVTKDMVVRSSAKVLQKYLLRELVEEETPSSWSEMADWFINIGASISEGLTSASEALGTLFASVSLVFVSEPTVQQRANAELALTRRGAVPVSKLQAAITQYNEAVKTLAQQEEAFSKLTSESTDFTKAKGLVAKWKLQVQTLKETVFSLNGKVDTQMNDGLRAVKDLGTEISEASLKRFQELVVIQRQCLRLMSPLL